MHSIFPVGSYNFQLETGRYFWFFSQNIPKKRNMLKSSIKIFPLLIFFNWSRSHRPYFILSSVTKFSSQSLSLSHFLIKLPYLILFYGFCLFAHIIAFVASGNTSDEILRPCCFSVGCSRCLWCCELFFDLIWDKFGLECSSFPGEEGTSECFWQSRRDGTRKKKQLLVGKQRRRWDFFGYFMINERYLVRGIR